MRKKYAVAWLLALCFMLTGCGERLLERSYSVVEPHSATYWENEDTDTLRAENYQELVNALLLLVASRAESGVVRLYSESDNLAQMSSEACNEVQHETDLGSYMLDYITYSGTDERSYYELEVSFGYRRSEEQYAAIVNATSTEAIPDQLRAAVAQEAERLTLRVGYFTTDRAGVEAMVEAVHEEYEDAPPWAVYFYPAEGEPGIVEIVLRGVEELPIADSAENDEAASPDAAEETPDDTAQKQE